MVRFLFTERIDGVSPAGDCSTSYENNPKFCQPQTGCTNSGSAYLPCTHKVGTSTSTTSFVPSRHRITHILLCTSLSAKVVSSRCYSLRVFNFYRFRPLLRFRLNYGLHYSIAFSVKNRRHLPNTHFQLSNQLSK